MNKYHHTSTKAQFDLSGVSEALKNVDGANIHLSHANGEPVYSLSVAAPKGHALHGALKEAYEKQAQEKELPPPGKEVESVDKSKWMTDRSIVSQFPIRTMMVGWEAHKKDEIAKAVYTNWPNVTVTAKSSTYTLVVNGWAVAVFRYGGNKYEMWMLLHENSLPVIALERHYTFVQTIENKKYFLWKFDCTSTKDLTNTDFEPVLLEEKDRVSSATVQLGTPKSNTTTTTVASSKGLFLGGREHGLVIDAFSQSADYRDLPNKRDVWFDTIIPSAAISYTSNDGTKSLSGLLLGVGRNGDGNNRLFLLLDTDVPFLPLQRPDGSIIKNGYTRDGTTYYPYVLDVNFSKRGGKDAFIDYKFDINPADYDEDEDGDAVITVSIGKNY